MSGQQSVHPSRLLVTYRERSKPELHQKLLQASSRARNVWLPLVLGQRRFNLVQCDRVLRGGLSNLGATDRREIGDGPCLMKRAFSKSRSSRMASLEDMEVDRALQADRKSEQELLGQSAVSRDMETTGWRAEVVVCPPRQQSDPSEHTACCPRT